MQLTAHRFQSKIEFDETDNMHDRWFWNLCHFQMVKVNHCIAADVWNEQWWTLVTMNSFLWMNSMIQIDVIVIFHFYWFISFFVNNNFLFQFFLPLNNFCQLSKKSWKKQKEKQSKSFFRHFHPTEFTWKPLK